MKFCQARLSPPLIGQIAAEASLDASEEYARETYDEYVERRKCLIDGLNRIPGVYSPIPMGAFYTVAKLPVDDAEKFCAWCLNDFEYEGQTVMMAPASGFYTTPGLGKNEVRMAYVLKKKIWRRHSLYFRRRWRRIRGKRYESRIFYSKTHLFQQRGGPAGYSSRCSYCYGRNSLGTGCHDPFGGYSHWFQEGDPEQGDRFRFPYPDPELR